jgi:hypothetical protein
LIKYLTHNQIDKKKWDNCIRLAFNGNAYAVSWYLDLVHEGWEALVENDYERVMPLTAAKKFGVSYLFQPYFTQQLGVFSKSKLSPKVVETFIRHIPSRFKFAEINLNCFNKISSEKFRVSRNSNFLLDLINPYDRIAKKYTTNTRRNLKKSAAQKLSLSKNIKPEELIALFRNNRGAGLTKWKAAHYHILQRIMYTAIYKRRGMLYGIYTEFNELCAAAFFLKNNNRLVFLFSGANQTARETGAMTLLIDSVIREHASSSTVFDFEGSNDANLARFYRGFGAKKNTYPALQINKLRFPVKQMFNIYKSFKN